MATRNSKLVNIVEAAGGTVTDEYNRNTLLQDWLDALLTESVIKYEWTMNGLSYAQFDLIIQIDGDFTHTLTGTFSSNGFHLLSNNAGSSSQRVFLYASTRKLYNYLDNECVQLTEAEFNTLTDGNVHTMSYGRVGGVWFMTDNGESIGASEGEWTYDLSFNNFGDQYSRGATGIPLFEGTVYDHAITGAGTVNYPDGEIVIPFNEPYSDDHYFYDADGNLLGIKHNDVAADYTEV